MTHFVNCSPACYRCHMLAAQIVGVLLFVGLIIWDWIQFNSFATSARSYGCSVAQIEDYVVSADRPTDLLVSSEEGAYRLPHGTARLYRDECLIMLKPHVQSFSIRFRTAWPMKAMIQLESSAKGLHVRGVKKIPWSSALLTLTWFMTVAVGTLGFLITFLVDGGFTSLGGVLLGIGILTLGMFVFGFGLVIVALGYRIENQRLTEAYEELHQMLSKASPLVSAPPTST